MNIASTERRPGMVLDGTTAADLMTANPLSIAAGATVREAVAFLTDRGFSAAPVIDEAGRPVGVVSRSDVLVHDRENNAFPRAEIFDPADRAGCWAKRQTGGTELVDVDRACVRDIMTPAVFSVPADTSAARAVEEMLALHVHHLFVVDSDGVLVGVISGLDVLRHLRAEGRPVPDPAPTDHRPDWSESW